MSVTSNITTIVAVNQTGTAGLGTTSNVINASVTTAFSSGTGSGAVDTCLALAGTIAATTLDVSINGTQTDAFGVTLAMARVKLSYVRNKATNDSYTLTVGAAASTIFSSWISTNTEYVNVPASGILLLTAPLATGFTAGSSNKLLRLASGANSVAYELVILGCTA